MKSSQTTVVALLLLTLMFVTVPTALAADTNYDESKVPQYTLPDPLVNLAGERVTTVRQWQTQRRPEILELFRKYVYGRSPAAPADMTFHVNSVDNHALNDRAVRKLVTVDFTKPASDAKMDILIYLPNDAKSPVPLFVGLNFFGNHTIQNDPAVPLSTRWMRRRDSMAIVKNRATEASRGKASSRWPVPEILKRGYAVATVYCGDLDPDFDDGFKNGIHGTLDRYSGERPSDAWGTISAWAWGLSRAMDYFETDDSIDHKHVAVLGHSRLGKTALWAGAQDERFALVISNDSGCGGAALSRRRFGETVARINTSFPHWFCGAFKEYNNNEDQLPVDQHMLISLIAPRPVYVASAQEDRWADPKGEFLSAKHADPVYRLLGTEGLPADEMPAVGQPVHGTIAYHIRPGKHDVTSYDWGQYMDFADQHFGQTKK